MTISEDVSSQVRVSGLSKMRKDGKILVCIEYCKEEGSSKFHDGTVGDVDLVDGC